MTWDIFELSAVDGANTENEDEECAEPRQLTSQLVTRMNCNILRGGAGGGGGGAKCLLLKMTPASVFIHVILTCWDRWKIKFLKEQYFTKSHYSYKCVWTYMTISIWPHICVQVHVYICAQVCGRLWSSSGVFPRGPLITVLEIGSFTETWGSLILQSDWLGNPRFLLTLLSYCWDNKSSLSCSPFYWVQACMESALLTETSSQPQI